MSRLIDITGNSYGRLVVVERSGSAKDGKATWLCNCICGKSLIVQGKDLRSGNTKSCGCLHLEINSQLRTKDEIGGVYDRLTVIKRAGTTKGGQATWLCKCDCEDEVVVEGAKLRDGHTKSCGCLKHENKGRQSHPFSAAAFNSLFRSMESGAKRRDLEWSLNEEQVMDLTKQNCYYCGIGPQQEHQRIGCNGSYIYNGLDRIDNAKGYITDNIVSCCKYCNFAKHDRSLEDFMIWISRIYKHNVEDKINADW